MCCIYQLCGAARRFPFHSDPGKTQPDFRDKYDICRPVFRTDLYDFLHLHTTCARIPLRTVLRHYLVLSDWIGYFPPPSQH